MTWPGLTHDVEHWLFMFHLSSMLNDKEGANTQEIWDAPNQNSRIWYCNARSWIVWIWWDHSIYNKDTSQNTKTHSLFALIMIDPATKHRMV
jgi:hypothetical protein